MGFKLVARDESVINELARWRFCLSRQIKLLCAFSSQRTCDRRIKKLIEAGYIERKHILYGIPSLYFATRKTKKVFGLNYFPPASVRVEQIIHDITVIDTFLYLKEQYIIESLMTERQLKHSIGFGKAIHVPDFIFEANGLKYCVEIELSEKTFRVLKKNVSNNYLDYDAQLWIVPNNEVTILNNLEILKKDYSNIEIIKKEVVYEFLETIQKK